MRALLCIIVVATSCLASAKESYRVDGVAVFGNLRAVSVGDIRETITKYIGSVRTGRKPRALEVVSRNEIRAYHPERDLGWSPMRRANAPAAVRKLYPPNVRWDGWYDASKPIEDIPEALRLIRTADEAYVFPVTFTRKDTRSGETVVIPHRDHSAHRLLGREPRREVTRLLGDEKSWFHGVDSTISLEHTSRNVGLLFRGRGGELVLFCTIGNRVESTFNGQYTAGSLEDKPAQEMENWKERNAREQAYRRDTAQ
jgi:hypothetical protein